MAFKFIAGNDPPQYYSIALAPCFFGARKKNHSPMARGLRECYLNKSVRSGKEIRIIIEAGPTIQKQASTSVSYQFLISNFLS